MEPKGRKRGRQKVRDIETRHECDRGDKGGGEQSIREGKKREEPK